MVTLIMLIAGWYDYMYRKIPVAIPLLLCIYSFIFRPIPVIYSISAVAIIGIPFLIISILTDKLKGGDIKYVISLAMVMGINRLLQVFILTTIVAVVYTAATKQKSIPLATFIAIAWLGIGLFLLL